MIHDNIKLLLLLNTDLSPDIYIVRLMAYGTYIQDDSQNSPTNV